MSDYLIPTLDASTGAVVERQMSEPEIAEFEAYRSVPVPADFLAPAPAPAADRVLQALDALDPSTASVADVVNAVKAALAS